MSSDRFFPTESTPTVLLTVIVCAAFLGLFAAQFSSSQNLRPGQSIDRKRTLAPHDELYAVDLSQGGRGWVVGKFGMILHTDDGGKSWTQQNSGTRKPLTSVSFADERHGFAVGGGGVIVATVDGGQSWQGKDSTTKEHLLEVRALSAKKAFVVGAFGTLLSTNDSGSTWTKHKLAWENLVPRLIRESGYVEPNLNTVYFIGDKGWVAGEFGLLLHTRDDGRTWSPQRYGSNLPRIAAIGFSGERNGWAVGQQGTFLMTADGGDHWEATPLRLKEDLYAISAQGERAVIVGQGVILKTNNSGSTWVRIEAAAQNFWLSGVALNGETAIAVGQSGTIQSISLKVTAGLVPNREAIAP